MTLKVPRRIGPHAQGALSIYLASRLRKHYSTKYNARYERA